MAKTWGRCISHSGLHTLERVCENFVTEPIAPSGTDQELAEVTAARFLNSWGSGWSLKDFTPAGREYILTPLLEAFEEVREREQQSMR